MCEPTARTLQGEGAEIENMSLEFWKEGCPLNSKPATGVVPERELPHTDRS